MAQNRHRVQGKNGCPILIRKWSPEGEIKGLVHILHGMAEHGLRYEEFADFLSGKGFVVWVHDHRQHGYSVKHHQYGVFDKTDSWETMVKDVAVVQNHFKHAYPDLPMFLLGHSMGSIILRSYLQTEPTDIAGAVMVGSPEEAKVLLIAAIAIANLISAINSFKPSALLNQLSLGKFNKAIKNPKTAFDWLSHDSRVVKAYAEDPMCGYAYNPFFYREFSRGLLQANALKHMKNFPSTPMLMISGEEDPVGGFGKGIKKISDRYNGLGRKHKLTLLRGMRHEVLNEIKRFQAYELVGTFLLENI